MEKQYKVAVAYALTKTMKAIIKKYNLPLKEALQIAKENFESGMTEGMFLNEREAFDSFD